MSGGDRFLFEVAQTSILTSLTDQRAIAYRQHIVADCLKNAAIVRACIKLPSTQSRRNGRTIGASSRVIRAAYCIALSTC